jgi:outer membrane lipoprotein LolB
VNRVLRLFARGACIPAAFIQATLVLVLLSGCASQRLQPPHDPATQATQAHWQGKLSVKVWSQPMQAFSANFELQGLPSQGELLLSTALGTTVAHMQWQPGVATLQANGSLQQFDSLQELARQSTGTELPIASLFAWLQGQEEVATGWQVDMQDLPQGRLLARRVDGVQAELKIILER